MFMHVLEDNYISNSIKLHSLYILFNYLLYLHNTNSNDMTKGGARLNSGPKRKYNEQTKMVAFRCPVSMIDELKKIVNSNLDKWKTNNNTVKVSDSDKHLLSDRKYTVKKLHGRSHICRTVESSRGKYNVLLAQDIIGINCEIKFIDGNTLNCMRDNFRPVNREVEFLY